MKKATPVKSSRLPKFIITLIHLVELKNQGLNELEALTLYGETCLHSTISTLKNSHGISFNKKIERHRHRGGGITRFMRYSISDSETALKLIDRYKGSRI
jgi:hypothetical protein